MRFFEKESIKYDKDYYQIISSYIDIMILHFHKKKSFDFKKFSNEILAIAENEKYSPKFTLAREYFVS